MELCAREKTEAKMQKVLDKMNLPFKVVWSPDPDNKEHGIVILEDSSICLFDVREEDAWTTFTHEILELKLKEILKVYRMVINGLIEVIEKTCYSKKESFIESVPQIFKLIEEEKRIEQG